MNKERKTLTHEFGDGSVCCPSYQVKEFGTGRGTGPGTRCPNSHGPAPPVGPRFCHICHVEFSPTPRRGSPSHARLVYTAGEKSAQESFVSFFRVCGWGAFSWRSTKPVGDPFRHTSYKFSPTNSWPFFANSITRTMFCQTHNVRPRSRQFIEARVLRLLWDTCCHHAEARVHPVAASPSVRADLDGRDLESPRSPPHRRPIKPPLLRFLLLACLIKARVPRVSSGLPVQPPSVQPPEAEWI